MTASRVTTALVVALATTSALFGCSRPTRTDTPPSGPQPEHQTKSAGAPAAQRAGDPTMTPRQTLALDLLPQGDAALFAFDDDDVLAAQQALSRTLVPDDGTPPDLLALAAPRTVDLTVHQQVPLVVIHLATGQRRWEVSTNENTYVIATDRDTGATFTGHLFSPMKRGRTPIPSATPPAPGRVDALSVGTSVRRADLLEGLALPRGSSRYAVTVLVHDWRSNTVEIDLRTDAPRDTPTWPANDSSVTITPRNDAVPLLDGGARVAAVVPARAKSGPVLVQAAARCAASGGATAHVALVVLRLDGPLPTAVTAHVPLPSGATGDVDVACNVDLRTAAPDALVPGRHLVYAFAGTAAAGPYPLVVE